MKFINNFKEAFDNGTIKDILKTVEKLQPAPLKTIAQLQLQNLLKNESGSMKLAHENYCFNRYISFVDALSSLKTSEESTILYEPTQKRYKRYQETMDFDNES